MDTNTLFIFLILFFSLFGLLLSSTSSSSSSSYSEDGIEGAASEVGRHWVASTMATSNVGNKDEIRGCGEETKKKKG